MGKRPLHFILAALIGIIVLFAVLQAVNIPPGWDFRNCLWGPVNLLVNGQSPYRIELLFENSGALWMPVLLGISFPLGYLSLQVAGDLWLALNVAAFLAIIAIGAVGRRLKPLTLALLMVTFAIFPATINALILGQVSLITCLILTLVAHHDRRIHPVIIGILLAISQAKPQLSYLFIFSYLVLLWRDGQKASSIVVIGSALGFFLLACAPLFLYYPGWLFDFIDNLKTNNVWLQPSLYSLLLSQANVVLRALFLIGGLGLVLYLSLKLPQKSALLWTLGLTPILSPYIWTWDFVLMYPLLIDTFAENKTRLGRWIIPAGVIAAAAVFIGMKLSGLISDELYWWAPFALLSMVLISKLSQKSGGSMDQNPA